MINGVNLLVVRHAQTIWGSLGIVQGQLDSPLTNLGKEQAIKIARKIKNEINCDVIVSSDLDRAIKTAGMIVLMLGKSSFEKLYYFRERHLGVFQGKSKKELYQKWQNLFNVDGKLINADKVPGIELEEKFSFRIKSGLAYLKSHYNGKQVVLITHGGVIRFLYAYKKKLSLSSIYAKISVRNVEMIRF